MIIFPKRSQNSSQRLYRYLNFCSILKQTISQRRMDQVLGLASYTGAGVAFARIVGGNARLGGMLGAGAFGVVSYLRTPHEHPLPTITGGGIVISGASSGIGYAAAKELAGLGYTVFAGVRKEKDGVALKIAGCIPIILEVTSEESVALAAEQVRSKLAAANKPLVALINNAGISGTQLPLELETETNLDRVDSVNVRGIIRMNRHFVQLLREGNALGNSGGRIINIGSVLGHLTIPNGGAYCMSKHAVEAITKVMRAELAQFGIAVSVINPGFVRTEIANKSADAQRDELRALRAAYSKEKQQLYPNIFGEEMEESLSKEVKEMFNTCPPPKASTTPAIVHAITSTRPEPFYIVANLRADRSYPSASLGVFVSWLLPEACIAPKTKLV